MYSFLTTIKITIKSLIKSAPINLLFFIGLPVFMTIVMGSINDGSENPIEIEAKAILITDEDNTIASKNLKTFLASDEIKKLFIITEDKSEAYLEVFIPEGFEDTLINNTPTNININELKDRYLSVLTMKEILNSYIDNYKSGNLSSTLKESSITTDYIEPIIAENSYASNSVKMFGFLISMIFMTLTASSYASEDLGLNKRIYASPKSNLILFLENFVTTLIQALILILGYVLFFRLTNISFKGNFTLLILISVAAAFTITSLTFVISAFCKKKYGTTIVNILFFAHIAIGNVFINFGDKLAMLSPFTTSQQMFHHYVYSGTFDAVKSNFLLTILLGLIFFILALVKECKYRREI